MVDFKEQIHIVFIFLYEKLLLYFISDYIIGHFSFDLFSRAKIQGATLLFSQFILL